MGISTCKGIKESNFSEILKVQVINRKTQEGEVKKAKKDDQKRKRPKSDSHLV
jgi:hypothetical protein